MKRVVINCETGQAEITELSYEEESERLAEIEQAKELAEIQQRLEAKRLLAKELAELREMKQNRTLFDDTDIAEKQTETDRLISRSTLDNLSAV